MDQVELGDRIAETQVELAHLQARETRGKVLTVAGISTLFTSLGLTVAQSIAGAGITPGVAVPLALTGALGLTLFTTGQGQRFKATLAQDEARAEARHLQDLYNRRFGTEVNGPAIPQRFDLR
jgi:hypothetical protein